MSVPSTEGAAPVTTPTATAPAATPTFTITPSTTTAGSSNSLTTFTPITAPGQSFTAEDIERARRQEKEKLYPELEAMKNEVAALKKAREDEDAARQAEIARLASEKAAAEKAAADEELSVRELLTQQQAEFAQQLAAERAEREQATELLRLEQAYNALQQYRAERLAAEADNIMPELLEYIPQGPTAEAIEEGIVKAVAKTESVLQMATQGQQAARAAMPGVSVTSPPVGPTEINSGQQTYSNDELKNMSMEDYMKNRDKLLPAASQQRRASSGLFG